MIIKRLKINKINDRVQIGLGNDILDLYYDDLNALSIWLKETLPLLEASDRVHKKAEIEALKAEIQLKHNRITELENALVGVDNESTTTTRVSSG